jgi:hypothetical protein
MWVEMIRKFYLWNVEVEYLMVMNTQTQTNMMVRGNEKDGVVMPNQPMIIVRVKVKVKVKVNGMVKMNENEPDLVDD